jgi:hypothetical protein
VHQSISRREALVRIATATSAAGVAGALGRIAYDSGSARHAHAGQQALIRDCGVRDLGTSPKFAVARSCTNAAQLARRAIEGMGGMQRFIGRGDIVMIKPNSEGLDEATGCRSPTWRSERIETARSTNSGPTLNLRPMLESPLPALDRPPQTISRGHGSGTLISR